MTSMPTVNDAMIVRLRRLGRARRTYSANAPGRSANGSARVLLQQNPECSHPGAKCGCNPVTGHCLGVCDDDHNCIPS